MSGARTHGSLNDAEVEGAAWAAGRGAVVGAAKVRTIPSSVSSWKRSNDSIKKIARIRKVQRPKIERNPTY